MSSAEDAPQNGIFIVLEGADGSGKSTQYEWLKDNLAQAGYDVASIHFPRYDEPSSYFVRQYLKGSYGQADDVNPYTASLFYALDRYQAASEIRDSLKAGKIVLCDRFTGANMAHQGNKFQNAEERRGYFIWLDNLEFSTLAIPRPDITLVINTPETVVLERLEKKQQSSKHIKKDIHEADPEHIRKSIAVYNELCELFPKDYVRIDTSRGDELLAPEAVDTIIRSKLAPLLPPASRRTKQRNVSAAHIKPSASQSVPAGGPPRNNGMEAGTPAKADTQQHTGEKGSGADNPFIQKLSGSGSTGSASAPATYSFFITPAGQEYLQRTVTNPTGDVYAFTSGLPPATVAAAMARLSRRGDDMRITLLDEFAQALSQETDTQASTTGRPTTAPASKEIRKDEQLLHRVITAYGDDSVQQLVGVHLAVENASNILTKKLEWGRLAAYLEQSTRYIYYDQQDSNGRYRYHTPATFDPATTKAYEQTIDSIFSAYSTLVHKLTDYIREHSSTPAAERDGAWKSATRAQACDAARPVLPVATTSTVGIFASGQALESLIMHLMADELPEARLCGQRLLKEARKIMPAFLERADKPERGGALVAYRANTRRAMAELANGLLQPQHSTSHDTPVRLTDIWPRNEQDVVADMLYEHSDQPLQAIRQEVAEWGYAQKRTVMQTYMGERLNRRMRPGRALEKIHYSFDLLCDYGSFRDLQRHRMVDDLEWQALTPRFGYDIPKLVEDAGLAELFETCFDTSLQLYSLLQQNGYALEAQYATLLGHKMRWKVTYNAREAFHLHELRTSPQGHPGYRKLVGEMHRVVAEHHPLLAEAMRFVNQDEDPELTRLAAERYTQYKLQQLDARDIKTK